eukprot:COSAG05_NODE_350_length_10922_cov_2274.791370_1_plen_411_part_00
MRAFPGGAAGESGEQQPAGRPRAASWGEPVNPDGAGQLASWHGLPGMTISLADFLREAGLSGYEYALKEAGISCANDILEEDNPLDLLELSFVEQQNFVRALVELRRRVIPSLPLPPGKTIHFYVSHSSRDLVEPVVYSLERAGATIFTHHAVTYRRAQGSISRWHIPRSGYMSAGVHRTADRLGTGNYQHQYGGGGSNHKGVTLSPAVTQQLSMHRDLSQSLRGFSDTIAQAHPSHRRVLGETTSATAGLDETTEVGAEAFMRESRHTLLVLSAGTLSREYVLQELRWAVQHCVPIVGVYEEGLDVRTELKSAPPDLKATLAKIDLGVLSVTSGGGAWWKLRAHRRSAQTTKLLVPPQGREKRRRVWKQRDKQGAQVVPKAGRQKPRWLKAERRQARVIAPLLPSPSWA